VSVPGPDHERWRDDVAAYLLGALPAEDREGFEAHLAACPVCRAEAESLAVATDALPTSVPPVDPPDALKGRIMAVVEAEAALLAAAGAAADRPERAPAAPRRRWSSRLAGLLPRPALALATAVLLLGLGGLGGALLAGGAPEPRVIRAEVAPRGSTVVLRVQGDDAELLARGLPTLPRGSVYQLWVLPERPGAGPVPTEAVFAPRPDGMAVVAVPAGIDDVRQVLVTPERTTGATVPSRDPVIVVSPA